ncbi:phosphoribosylanthranilate isomerase [Daejeonella lutea]|uniref:N-(5'-phosphoribosyl)anthranilate isomerase n=1 Tax=Daejeonella lutea TaxID=572036 RepID=A0A1T5B6P8_9SPHI|nr:phosphoribosylanthranilate isomerase [Daejeonella lutea]SKB42906.1 phosphoribosylanthranilate isomerase [Daejeonella lutea]
MILKVCGMREPDNIRELVELQPDYIGFIFYPHSSRFAGKLDLTTIGQIPAHVKKTGVFVDEAMDTMADEVIQYNLDAIQLHGSESPEFCRSFKKFLHNMQTEKHVELIKAFGIHEGFDFTALDAYEDFVDYFLFDTSTAGHGGSGQTFDWNILQHYHGTKQYFLSGGLSPDNIDAVRSLKDVRLHGLDLNSKYEHEPALKDIDKIRETFDKIRALRIKK